MKILSVSYLCLLLLSCNISANKKSLVKGIEQTPKLTKEQLSNADSLDIKFQIRGFCYAYSSSKKQGKVGWRSTFRQFAKESWKQIFQIGILSFN